MTSNTQTLGRVCQFGILLLIGSALLAGCSRHPHATSRESMEFIKQVYTACNTKNTKRLAVCMDRLAELESDGKISKEEIESFQIVLDLAGKGEWESAQTMALKYAQDQIR